MLKKFHLARYKQMPLSNQIVLFTSLAAITLYFENYALLGQDGYWKISLEIKGNYFGRQSDQE